MKLRVLLNLKVRSIFGDVIEADNAFDLHRLAGRVEIEKRDAVAEHVVDPA